MHPAGEIEYPHCSAHLSGTIAYPLRALNPCRVAHPIGAIVHLLRTPKPSHTAHPADTPVHPLRAPSPCRTAHPVAPVHPLHSLNPLCTAPPSRASRPSAAAIAAARRSGPAPCENISRPARRSAARKRPSRRRPQSFLFQTTSSYPSFRLLAAISPKPQYAEPILRPRIFSPTALARRLNGLRQVGNVEDLVLIHILKAVLRLSNLKQLVGKDVRPQLRPFRRGGFDRRPRM